MDYIIPIADIIISSTITIIGVLISVRLSEKSSRKIQYASVKPLIYFLENKPNISNVRTFIFKSNLKGEATELFSYMKNADNGIAIIKRITLDNVVYYPAQECFVEKGENIKIVIKAVKASPTGIIDVYDIYDNLYQVHFAARGHYFEKRSIKKSHTPINGYNEIAAWGADGTQGTFTTRKEETT